MEISSVKEFQPVKFFNKVCHFQQVLFLGNDHNKPHSLMFDPTSTMYFYTMSCDLSNKILFKPTSFVEPSLKLFIFNLITFHLCTVVP